MKILKAVTAGLMLAATPLLAQAEGMSYSYLDLGYVETDIDGVGPTADGFGLRGSVGVAKNFFVFADYSDQEVANIDVEQIAAGLGGRYGLSDNLDLGAEWYFTEKSVLGVALFYKDVESFISFPTTQEPLRPEDRAAVAAVFPTQPQLLDPSLIWTYSTAANSDGTKLKGFEIAYQQSFKGLPGILSNFGFTGNYSYVDAETEVTRSGRVVSVPLTGMSNNSWNATLYYETPRWGSRVSVNNRDDYITNNLGQNGNISEATTGPVRWDMSAFYHLTESFSLSLEGINLTDEEERLYTTGDGTMNLIREINQSGRQVFLGVRWNL